MTNSVSHFPHRMDIPQGRGQRRKREVADNTFEERKSGRKQKRKSETEPKTTTSKKKKKKGSKSKKEDASPPAQMQLKDPKASDEIPTVSDKPVLEDDTRKPAAALPVQPEQQITADSDKAEMDDSDREPSSVEAAVPVQQEAAVISVMMYLIPFQN